MKHIIIRLITVALLTFGSLVTGNAMAQGPNRYYRGQASGQRVVVYAGGGGYGVGYGGGYGAASGIGYAPYGAVISPYYYPQYAPYGAGFSGGYRPYQEMYLQRLYYGLGN
jgi:hypothetical protein